MRCGPGGSSTRPGWRRPAKPRKNQKSPANVRPDGFSVRTTYINALSQRMSCMTFSRFLGMATLAFASLGATPALAQDRVVPSSMNQLRLSYAPIVQHVQPAVVNVYAAKIVQNRNPLLDDPIFRRFFGVPGGQQEQMQRSLGSGVLVDSSGLVVTNNHVIEGADQVKVSLSDKREFEAEIVLKDSRTDLAVLRLKGTHEKFPTLDLANSDELQVGDVVLAIGNPFGVGQTVTHGIVSALAGLKLSDLVVSIDGQAVDDPNAFDYRFATRPIGGTAQIDVLRSGKTVKVSIPLEVAPDTGRDEIELKSRSPYQGARVANISPALADELRLDSNVEGVAVVAVGENALASNVGFQKGDIITAVTGKAIAKTGDLERATSEPARLWRITIIRGGQRINVTLGG